MADPDDRHAPLPPDYSDRDVEEIRRDHNRHHRPFRARGRRDRWLDAIAAIDPAAHAELVALRSDNPQAFRKRLVHVARAHGVYEAFDGYGDRDLPPLAARRAEPGSETPSADGSTAAPADESKATKKRKK